MEKAMKVLEWWGVGSEVKVVVEVLVEQVMEVIEVAEVVVKEGKEAGKVVQEMVGGIEQGEKVVGM
jgi:hypothetical protein